MRSLKHRVLIPLLFLPFLFLWISPVCGGENLSVSEYPTGSTPSAKTEGNFPPVVRQPPKLNQPDLLPSKEDEDEDEDDWDKSTIYDNDKGC